MKLVVATRNEHKLVEIGQMFDIEGLELVSLGEYPDAPDVEEDRDTFEGNAIKKAVSAAIHTGEWCMADDSGLEVDALGGAPGVYSARYAGEPADHAANNRKLRKALEGGCERGARFRCVIAISDPDGQTSVVDGACEGMIAHEPAGECGFGYDPLFIPEGYEKSFAELGLDIKNGISHRGNALREAAKIVGRLIER